MTFCRVGSAFIFDLAGVSLTAPAMPDTPGPTFLTDPEFGYRSVDAVLEEGTRQLRDIDFCGAPAFTATRCFRTGMI